MYARLSLGVCACCDIDRPSIIQRKYQINWTSFPFRTECFTGFNESWHDLLKIIFDEEPERGPVVRISAARIVVRFRCALLCFVFASCVIVDVAFTIWPYILRRWLVLHCLRQSLFTVARTWLLYRSLFPTFVHSPPFFVTFQMTDRIRLHFE